MATPLAVLVGLKDPHAEPVQLTVHLTPAFALSLVTVAVRLAVALATSVVGGELRATEIAGGVGGGVDEDPPQEVRQTAIAATAESESK